MSFTFALDVTDSYQLANEEIRNAKQKKGFALSNYFYRSQLIYQRELTAIIFKSWFYACHLSEIPNRGDFKTVEVGEDSIIVARDKHGKVVASANNCRHRGARVCHERSGNTSAFVCPYHAWVYDLDGSLKGAREMGKDFDKSKYALRKIRTHIFQGMIFINCDLEASDFSLATDKLLPFIKPYQLDKAKVAAAKTYVIPANWKLALENYLECYHCGPSHQEYGKSHTLKEKSPKVDMLNESMKKRAVNELGFDPTFVESMRHEYMNAPAFGCDITHTRYALYENYKTGSIDGEAIAPFMGNMSGYDGGVGDFQLGPLTFMLNYPDHCVLYRFLPKGLQNSEIEIVWFVRGDAVEGKDYELERLIKLWDFTTKEDEYIIMRNHEGVNSSFYQPGPYHPTFESLCINFIQWYLNAIEKEPNTPNFIKKT